MKLQPFTIKHLCRILNGDTGHMPYLSGPRLVELCNRHGSRDSYGQGFPSRWKYVEDKLTQLNGSQEIEHIIEETLDPRAFSDSNLDIEAAVTKINELLQYDGYQILSTASGCRILNITTQEIAPDSLAKIEDDFVQSQLDKCNRKLTEADYDGAITNARTLAETVIVDILKRCADDYDHKGDLVAAYKRLKALLNLEPGDPHYPDCVKQILSGLNSIIVGLSSLRNEMGDAHPRRIKPELRHARLAVNASKTITAFLLESFKKQFGSMDRAT